METPAFCSGLPAPQASVWVRLAGNAHGSSESQKQGLRSLSPWVLALPCVVWWRPYSISGGIGFQPGLLQIQGWCLLCSQSWKLSLPSFLFPNTIPSYKRFSGNCTHAAPVYHMPSARYHTETWVFGLSPLIVLLHHLWKSGYNTTELVNYQNQGSVWPPTMFNFAYSVLVFVPTVRSFTSFDNS